MDWRKLIKSILYPHTAVMVVLLPIAAMFLVFSMVYIGTELIPAIAMAAVCVSMLTLESTMLTTFNDGSMSLASRRIMLGTTGTAVSAFVITMAVVMIVQSIKRIKEMKIQEEKSNGEQG